MRPISYLPWSVSVLDDCVANEKAGRLACLDLDLTAKCSQASCVYCDSKPTVGTALEGEMGLSDLRPILDVALNLGLKWVFTCGLGEPLEDPKFVGLVETLARGGARVSAFTNGMLIDAKTAKWLHANHVCLVMKLDCLDEAVFDRILGGKGRAARVYLALENLLGAGYGRGCPEGITDLALSIVPTKLNLHLIRDVLELAKRHNFFPSVGELECAGRAADSAVSAELQLDVADFHSLRSLTDEVLWTGYRRSVCPAVLTGIHIDVKGRCIVDRMTGLNCKWFMMQEPDVQDVGLVSASNLVDIVEQVRRYRMRALREPSVIGLLRSTTFEFGGCGGDPSAIAAVAGELFEP